MKFSGDTVLLVVVVIVLTVAYMVTREAELMTLLTLAVGGVVGTARGEIASALAARRSALAPIPPLKGGR
jgi:hypothetical protein